MDKEENMQQLLWSADDPRRSWGGAIMKWKGRYLPGYVIASVGTFWTGVGTLIAMGLGVMVAIANSGVKRNVRIGRR